MIPREAKRGQSFKGAGLYYLHDKDALTSERVAFTHTENLPTDDPEQALRVMASTAADAPALKRAAGAKRAGGRCQRPVFCFSLSWHPEDQPDQAHMISAGQRALAVLGLQDHETLMVSHRDEAHPHLHLIVNIINPLNGRANSVPFSKRKLSQWAEEYEREHGKIYCQQRVENNERRRRKEYVKYKDPELDQKAIITKLYQAAENGQAFKAALENAGYKLAQGKRLVLIDQNGKTHSLSRQIEGVKAKDIRKKLGDLELPPVENARGDQQGSGGGLPGKDVVLAQDAPEKGSEQSPAPPAPRVLNRTQDRHIEERGRFSDESQIRRLGLKAILEKQYGEDERRLRREIAAIEETLKRTPKSKQTKPAENDLYNMRLSLENLEWRRNEAELGLEHDIRKREQVLIGRQQAEWESVQAGFPTLSPDPAPDAISPYRDFQGAAPSALGEFPSPLTEEFNSDRVEAPTDRARFYAPPSGPAPEEEIRPPITGPFEETTPAQSVRFYAPLAGPAKDGSLVLAREFEEATDPRLEEQSRAAFMEQFGRNLEHDLRQDLTMQFQNASPASSAEPIRNPLSGLSENQQEAAQDLSPDEAARAAFMEQFNVSHDHGLDRDR